MFRRFATALFLLAALFLYERAKRNAPDPYAVCEGKPTEAERRQCRSAVAYSLSAGW